MKRADWLWLASPDHCFRTCVFCHRAFPDSQAAWRARHHRAGELTTIWVPDPAHEAIRDLVPAREAAMEDLRAKRQQLQSFLLRNGRI
jgi:hypothetical protein